MSELVHGVLQTSMLLAAVASLAAWCFILFQQRSASQPFLDRLVPVRKRQRPFWNPTDALVMFGVQVLMLALMEIEVKRRGIGDSILAANAMVICAGLTSVTVALLWLRLIDPHPVRKLSLIPTLSDVWLGLKASILILPPVMILHALCSRFVEYEHDVFDMLAQLDSFVTFSVLFAATAFVTPLVEELLIRVLLQGGLQRMIDPESSGNEFQPGDGSWEPKSYLPILIASALFALMHLPQGAAAIPLFFFALGVGYLYRQTGNITSPMVVHMVLNGLTLCVIYTQPAPPAV